MFSSGILSVLCVCLAGSLAQSAQYCKDRSWQLFGDSCYSFVLPPRDTKLDYYDAEDYCRSKGAHLVSIHSQAEYEFVITAASKNYRGRRWIGLNELRGENNREWSDGTPVNFFVEESKKKYQKELCFVITKDGWSNKTNGWWTQHCNQPNHPICKRPNSDVTPTALPPPTTPAPPKGNCPEKWKQFGDKCYLYSGERLDFKQAGDACAALGSDVDLVSIHSRQEQAFVTQHLPELGMSAWIGVKLVESDEIGRDMVFGFVDNSRNDFTHWLKGHPPFNTWKYCGRLNYEGFGKGEWVADYCETEKYGYICQSPSNPELPVQPSNDPKCEDGYTGYRNSCYAVRPEATTFQEAEKACQVSGGHLVSVVDSFEQAFLLNFLGERQRALWIGLRNEENSRFLQWIDSQPLYYSNWAAGQPDFGRAGRSCAFLDTSNDLRWNLTECATELPFVCEISKESPPPPPVAVKGECPSTDQTSWIDIGDEFCYHLGQSENRRMSWEKTSRYCATKGMTMITLTSDHQSKSLASYSWQENQNMWIGLIRASDKDPFVWMDGSPLNYTRWAEREPQGSTWSEDRGCATVSPLDLRWRSTSCGAGAVAACRARKS